MTSTRFDSLLAEGEAVPLDGWDFSWFDGRASEERPRWRYTNLLADRLSRARAALDLQTGGGEVLATALRAMRGGPPSRVAATESWPPNVAIARSTLRVHGADVVQVEDDAELPFADASFDLVSSRHPTLTSWPQIARVLTPGGAYLSQQVGAGSNRELIDHLMGPQAIGDARDPQRAVHEAQAVGLEVVDLREQALRVEFHDVGAVVHFLRKVLWTVPGFTVAAYRDRLADLHHSIETDGPFVCHSQRFLIEARKPVAVPR